MNTFDSLKYIKTVQLKLCNSLTLNHFTSVLVCLDFSIFLPVTKRYNLFWQFVQLLPFNFKFPYLYEFSFIFIQENV